MDNSDARADQQVLELTKQIAAMEEAIQAGYELAYSIRTETVAAFYQRADKFVELALKAGVKRG